MRFETQRKWAAAVCGMIGALAIFYALSAKAFDVVKLDELGIEYRNYAMINENNRPLLIYPEHAKEALNLGLNTDILKYGYFDSLVESMTTGAQYRAIGLQLNLGVRILPEISVGYWHHSQHLLDRGGTDERPYPVEDAVVIRWTIFHARPGRPAIF